MNWWRATRRIYPTHPLKQDVTHQDHVPPPLDPLGELDLQIVQCTGIVPHNLDPPQFLTEEGLIYS